jgi:hypothetical protein
MSYIAHGDGQDARTADGTEGEPYSTAYGGEIEGWWIAVRGDGA